MRKTLSVVIAGVGGQGVLLASDLLAEAGLLAGLDAKKAEVHGMAQRGGSVVTHVRIGEKVWSPLVEKGRADILIGFEPLEMIRYIDFVNPDSHVFFNTARITPTTAVFGDVPYPAKPEELVVRHCANVHPVDATATAAEVGLPNAVNVVMIGAVSPLLPFDDAIWFEAIARKVKAKFVDVNKKAFTLGRERHAVKPPEASHA